MSTRRSPCSVPTAPTEGTSQVTTTSASPTPARPTRLRSMPPTEVPTASYQLRLRLASTAASTAPWPTMLDRATSPSTSATTTAAPTPTPSASTIANVAPGVTLSGPTTANEGQHQDLHFTITDPGRRHVYLRSPRPVAPTAAKSGLRLRRATRTGSFDCTFPDGPATQTVPSVSPTTTAPPTPTLIDGHRRQRHAGHHLVRRRRPPTRARPRPTASPSPTPAPTRSWLVAVDCGANGAPRVQRLHRPPAAGKLRLHASRRRPGRRCHRHGHRRRPDGTDSDSDTRRQSPTSTRR